MTRTFLLFSFFALSAYSYTLKDEYSGDSFADKFNFFTEADPTHGTVKYVDRQTAEQTGLFKVI
jgi:hypothetical protein